MLEPDEGKLSRPVLRRGDGSNSVPLAGEWSLRSNPAYDHGTDGALLCIARGHGGIMVHETFSEYL